MKKFLATFFLSTLFFSIAAAAGESENVRYYCQSWDEKKTVRTAPGPWDYVVAKVYHEGSLYKTLKCEQDTPEYLFDCKDENNPPAVFTLNYDGVSAKYQGGWNVRDMFCRAVD